MLVVVSGPDIEFEGTVDDRYRVRLIGALGIVAACTLAVSLVSVRVFEYAAKQGWVDLAPIPVLELIVGVPVGAAVGLTLARFTIYRRR